MARKPRPWMLLTPVLMLSTACSQAQEPAAPATAKDPATTETASQATSAAHPAPIRVLEGQGLEILGTFKAPSGLTGYAGLAGTNPVSVYVTADGQHALIGTLIDAEGQDLGARPLQELVLEPMSERSWAKLEGASWVPDGKPDAPRIVYTFTDPNCPYCHRFWEVARPWIEAGKVQLRHVMVGVIRPDSANKAAAILTATSPEQALTANERDMAAGGIEPLATIPAQARRQLDANQRLMLQLGFQGTPGIVFLDAQGNLQRRAGLPRGDDLETVLGPR